MRDYLKVIKTLEGKYVIIDETARQRKEILTKKIIRFKKLQHETRNAQNAKG